MFFSYYRTFTDPSRCKRIVVDAVSSLTTGILSSLRKGTVRGCSFSVSVRKDVFNYLFSNCGCRKCGKFYNRCDFNVNFFNDSDFVFRNSFNECICVDFPIYMFSSVKFIRLGDRVDFCETVCVTLVKKICSKINNLII